MDLSKLLRKRKKKVAKKKCETHLRPYIWSDSLRSPTNNGFFSKIQNLDTMFPPTRYDKLDLLSKSRKNPILQTQTWARKTYFNKQNLSEKYIQRAQQQKSEPIESKIERRRKELEDQSTLMLAYRKWRERRKKMMSESTVDVTKSFRKVQKFNENYYSENRGGKCVFEAYTFFQPIC